MNTISQFYKLISFHFLSFLGLCFLFWAQGSHGATCNRTLTANVVALDQVFHYNRLGAFNPAGMIYALKRDVVDANNVPLTQGGAATPGQVKLRPDKRPRPLVLRINVGDCLQIHFQNLLNQTPVDNQPATRSASIRVIGLQPVTSITDVGDNAGTNPSGLVAPGGAITYTLYAEKEGAYLLYSGGARTGGEGDGGSLAMGLFGSINVEPSGAEYYRSQITEEELRLAINSNHPQSCTNPATPGYTCDGHPLLNYDAVYPNAAPWTSEGKAGLPVLNILNGTEIVHSELTAIITGPNRGNFPAGTYPSNPVIEPNASVPQYPGGHLRTREEPFREITAIFHDEIKAIQAFDGLFEDPVLGHTLHSVRDGFGINLGVGGLGPMIIANRLGVGPMYACTECKYEEFFLSSWVGGDPAMIVDTPASNGLNGVTLAIAQDPNFKTTYAANLGPKATKALYPDDPSNVYHSYLGDHVKIRNLHAGPKEHHIFHLHAHQWLFTPDSDNSAYLDSQAIGPGSHYNLEINYNGSGNRNQTPGDSIFHCHLYPHFAQGMWALWRVHDTFEAGTKLAVSGNDFHDTAFALQNGTPAANSRALPDAEITAGTPIPALVPIPTLALAPMPGPVHIANGQVVLDDPNKNPGFPFFIPGKAGHRAPHPPLDTEFDGGLPRHVVKSGEASFPALNRLDFDKTNDKLEVDFLDENGVTVEQTAMAFHSLRTHDTVDTNGNPAKFVTNGLQAVAGAPFADPCVNDQGGSIGQLRTYKAAHIQMDMKINKVGHHFPQSRIHALWGDVDAYLNGNKAPEPMFFRVHSGDCVVYHLTNLLPLHYRQDDFQVNTPTDITGQHIHLVKFDVTASDGATNGFNYEDGAFGPEEVRERIDAIRTFNNCQAGWNPDNGHPECPQAKPHPYFQNVAGVDALGAQTVIQRWFADDVVNNLGKDRTLRTVYTHDHFSPSTHQQVGLYAGLVVEPAGTQWRDPETGVALGTRFDGGPTSWRADILTPVYEDYREFLLEYSDFQLAYEAGGGYLGPDPSKAINPPARAQIGLPYLVKRPDQCPGGIDASIAGCPEAISADDPGVFSVNYRNEPVALRVVTPPDPANPSCAIINGVSNCIQTPGIGGDLAFALRSDIPRAIPALNSQPGYYAPLTGGVLPGDPFTPLMRVYKGDNTQLRLLVGGQEEGHIISIHGQKWLGEPGDPISGWRNGQMTGISEHFELNTPIIPPDGAIGPYMDYLWTMDTSSDGFWNGVWGILRAYDAPQPDLLTLPNNPPGSEGNFQSKITNAADFQGVCPITAPKRFYMIYALPTTGLPGDTLTYNPYGGNFAGHPGPLHDPTAMIYALAEDVEVVFANGIWQFQLKAGAPVEPLVLRAKAGECIEVILRNALGYVANDMDGYNLMPMVLEGFNLNETKPALSVGLHPQLVAMDVTRYNGVNIGKNLYTAQTAGPWQAYFYRWYAGDLKLEPNGNLVATPVEFGAINLMPADVIKQSGKGLIGALVVEPADANWVEDQDENGNLITRTAATVTTSQGNFREFVVVMSNDAQLRDANNNPICPVEGGSPVCEGTEDPEDSGNHAFNLRSEPMWFRIGFDPGSEFDDTRNEIFTDALSNSQVGGDPATPVFHAYPGQAVRFRILQPGGHPRNRVVQLQGHIWQKDPYQAGVVPSQWIGDNPLSEWYGAQGGHGPANHFDLVLQHGAGGAFRIPGDYVLRDQASFGFDSGGWALLRVEEPENPMAQMMAGPQ